MNKTSYVKKKRKMQTFDYINYIILILCALLAFYPLYYVLIGSFSNGDAYMQGRVFLVPRKITLSNYKVILSDKTLWYALRNTLVKTIVGTASSLIFTSIVAYAYQGKI